MIESLLALKVVVPSAADQEAEDEKEKGKCELGCCGENVARHYIFSTTKVSHDKSLATQKWWVSSGAPLVIFEHTPMEVTQTTPSAFKIRRFSEEFTLYRDQLIYKGILVGVWIIEFDKQASINAPIARDLRICLSRIHAERECLKGMLRLLAQREISSFLSLTGEAFSEYLGHVVELLMKRSYYGFDQSEILEAAREFDALLKPGERDSIIREVEKLPVGKRIVRRLRELTAPQGEAGGTTNITAGTVFWTGRVAMRDQNIVGQGVAGANAHVHDVTFQQVWNNAAKGIDLATLADELSKVRSQMKTEATNDPDQDAAIGEVAAAEGAAKKGDGPMALQRLKAAGKWALDVATKIGASVATAALKASLGL